ncbi:MAG: peptidoglycan-binding protein [Flavobacteriaceae bacterium]|nr:peptidoglycan-binding protein [Flavobacteriaceae bacterium]
MKQIIIFLLVVILGVIVYGQYKKYKRFSLSEYEYTIPEDLKVELANKGLLLDYHRAIEAVNGHIITQWSAHKIDVRNPKKDNERTKAAVNTYRELLANVGYFESQIKNPMKKKEPKEMNSEMERNLMVQKMFYANPEGNSLRLGQSGALIFEVQRLLNEKGDSIKQDGLFNRETFTALQSFEDQNGLLPDGKLDALTLSYLLK